MRYFIHVQTGSHITDEVGQEFADLTSARAEAVQAALEIICLMLHQGEVISHAWLMEIADASGNVLETLPFGRIVFGGEPSLPSS